MGERQKVRKTEEWVKDAMKGSGTVSVRMMQNERKMWEDMVVVECQ